MILPKPIKLQLLDNELLLPFSWTVRIEEEYRDAALFLMETFFPGVRAASAERDCHVTVRKGAFSRSEAYTLQISSAGVSIEIQDFLGLRNALASLSLLAKALPEGYSFPCVFIEDAPEYSHRGVMLDLARGIRPFLTLLEDVVLIARAKMNVLHLHLSDSKGICFQSESLPEACWLPSAYSKEEMIELSSFARNLGLEVIPEFDLPAHSKRLIAVLPQLGCQTGSGENCGWTVCPSTEETYRCLEGVLREIAEIFPGKYFHIGGDELDFADVPHIRQTCHWDECARCQEQCEKNHWDRQDLYYHCILRVYEMVKKLGRVMVMWSDQLDCSRPSPLPRDIVMQFWRVSGKGRGPVENCSLNNQLKMGYSAINSHYKETYVDLDSYMNPEKLADWRPTRRPEVDPSLQKQILGSEICAWEYGNAQRYPHYDRTLAPSVFLMADRLWRDGDLVINEEYEKALTRAVLGASCPEDFNLCLFFGSPIPPRSEKAAYFERIQCTAKDVVFARGLLIKQNPPDHGSRYRIRSYLLALDAVLEFLQKKEIEP